MSCDTECMTKAQFVSSETVADGTMLFRFTKPEGFEFTAGQSVDLSLPSGAMHPYSLTSAPHEAELAIATRMRDSAYKNELKALKPEAEVTIEGPFGSFFLHENTERPAIFLVGGIGVTPFYSMAKDATTRALPHQIYMLYGNRSPRDAAFVTELDALAVENTNFKIQNVYGAHIDADMVRAFAPTDTNPVYYMAGPQGMVSAMRSLLKEMNVSNDDIKFEEFSGY